MMWGAKVKTPVDMPDDILKDSISKTKEVIGVNTHIDNDGMVMNNELPPFLSLSISDFNCCIIIAIKHIKDHMDNVWEPNW